MKIICNKMEFAQLVRNCAWSHDNEGCCGCIFITMCSGVDQPDGSELMESIEDICEVKDNG